MNIEFEATESTKAPLFLYEGKKVHVAAATYSYLTQTDEPNSGALVIVVDGYLDGETAMKRFICNMTEDTIEIGKDENGDVQIVEAIRKDENDG